MKSFKILSALAIVILFVSCSKDYDKEVYLSESEIPSPIIIFKTQHFSDTTLIRAIKDKEWNTTTYEVYLEGDFELEFNSSYEITDIDGSTKLPNSVIPQALLDYVSQNYTTNFITDWELELNHQQIELNNGIELEFEKDGIFIRVDND